MVIFFEVILLRRIHMPSWVAIAQGLRVGDKGEIMITAADTADQSWSLRMMIFLEPG